MKSPTADSKVVFYLHGRIVQEMDDPVHPAYGRYEYRRIVDTLTSFGFNVIAERRRKGTDMQAYADRVVRQIDSLCRKGTDPKRIYVVGASMGAGIALTTSAKLKNRFVNVAVLAACDDGMITFSRESNFTPFGNFLSIYEASDHSRSCESIFRNKSSSVSGFKEIKLTMGNRHGFIYRPYAEWVVPLVSWINQ